MISIRSSWIVSVAIGLLVLSIGTPLVPGQDDELGSKSYDELKALWSEVDTSMTAASAAFEIAEEKDRDKLRAEYTDLIDRANEIIAALKTAALAKIKQDPKDKDAIKTLLGIMINDARFGRDGDVLKLGDELIGAKINSGYFEFVAKQTLPLPTREMFEELVVRQREAANDDLPRVEISTNQGTIVVELYENEAPNTVANFISLVESNFYNGIVFHRVIDGFMAQGGRPEGDLGGPGYNIPCECYTPEARRHYTGTLSMAHRGRDTGGSQFFMTFSNRSSLDGKHTVFGRVIEGFEVLDKLARTHTSNQFTGADEPITGAVPDKIETAKVLRKRDHEYVPRKVGDPEEAVEPPTTQPKEELEKGKDASENKAEEKDDGQKKGDGGGP